MLGRTGFNSWDPPLFSKISTHLKYDLIFTKRTFLCLNSTWVECLPRDGQDGVRLLGETSLFLRLVLT